MLATTQIPAVPPPARTSPTAPRNDAPELLARLVFALAGRLPDTTAAVIRTRIADGDIEEAARTLRGALDDGPVGLTVAEAGLAQAGLAGFPDSSGFRPAHRTGPPARPEFRFSSPPDGPAARLLDAAVSVVGWTDGLAGLWLTLRTCHTATAAPVWLGEAQVGSDLIELTAEIQHRLASLGEVPPRVELFTAESDLTPYHRGALARADLVWVRSDLPEPQVAQTFDGVDPTTGPYFAPEHARLDGPQRDRVLAYLAEADALLSSSGEMVDVLAPETGTRIPMVFRCDGTWIWTEPTVYYLRRYGLAPEPALVRHALRATGAPPSCGPLTRARALAAITAPGTRPPAASTRPTP
ncbi:hypothetical protein [Micromonospora craniellae]|uniref:hypothetical protein n=1 Tax=Micromonospora craniellae TaxID=2294034 RepID=UPI001F2A651D|nr:hypothetical protein [Micromonospora craniellae]